VFCCYVQPHSLLVSCNIEPFTLDRKFNAVACNLPAYLPPHGSSFNTFLTVAAPSAGFPDLDGPPTTPSGRALARVCPATSHTAHTDLRRRCLPHLCTPESLQMYRALIPVFFFHSSSRCFETFRNFSVINPPLQSNRLDLCLFMWTAFRPPRILPIGDLSIAFHPTAHRRTYSSTAHLMITLTGLLTSCPRLFLLYLSPRNVMTQR
jgi:hypothetical protein